MTGFGRPAARDVGDAALALVLAVGGVAVTWFGRGAQGEVAIDGFGLALVAGAGLALAVRRRWPLFTFAVAAVLTSAYLIVGYPYGPILLAFFVAVYTLARHLPPDRSVPAALAGLLLLLVHLFTNEAALPWSVGMIPGSAWVVVPYAVGFTVRSTREAAARARAEAIRARVDDERLRVAQEVHDIVGHGLAAIKMQADVALHVLANKPDQAPEALRAISRTSGEALEELRATLAVVRRDAPEPGASAAPGLDRLAGLRDRMARSGVEVRLETAGAARSLPAAVELTAYRVVQESLTNVLRHSGATRATVAVAYRPGEVEITVTNPPPAGPHGTDRTGADRTVADRTGADRTGADRGGHGIAGMRHRVEAVGGRLSAGPAPDGGYAVRAVLPVGTAG